MSSKLERIKRVRSFLRHQSSPQSISEIHEAMVRRLGLEISRKTIERDILDLVEDGRLSIHSGTPAKYQLVGAQEIEVTLKVEEITMLISILGLESEIAQKLRSYLTREN